jgi:hypothetical protein
MYIVIDVLSICRTLKACTHNNFTSRGPACKQEVEEDLAIGLGTPSGKNDRQTKDGYNLVLILKTGKIMVWDQTPSVIMA